MPACTLAVAIRPRSHETPTSNCKQYGEGGVASIGLRRQVGHVNPGERTRVGATTTQSLLPEERSGTRAASREQDRLHHVGHREGQSLHLQEHTPRVLRMFQSFQHGTCGWCERKPVTYKWWQLSLSASAMRATITPLFRMKFPLGPIFPLFWPIPSRSPRPIPIISRRDEELLTNDMTPEIEGDPTTLLMPRGGGASRSKRRPGCSQATPPRLHWVRLCLRCHHGSALNHKVESG